MSGDSVANFGNLLKEVFEAGVMSEALPSNIMLYKWIVGLGNDRPFGGSKISFPVKTKRQAGAGFVADGTSTLPAATQTSAIKAEFNAFNLYGVGEFDDMVMDDTRNDEFAYENVANSAIDDLLQSLKLIINAAWYDDGRCRMGILPGADDQQTVTLKQPIHLFNGMPFDIYDATDDSTILRTGFVDAVDHQGVSGNLLQGTFTFSETALSGSAANDYVSPKGTIASGVQRAPWGLLAFCDSANPPLSNLGGVNRSTSGNEAWQGNKMTNSGTNRQWNGRMVSAMLQLIRRRTGKEVGAGDVRIINNWNIMQEIFEQQAPDKQIVVRGAEAMKVSAGFDGGSGDNFEATAWFNGVNRIHADEMAPANVQLFVTPEYLHLAHTGLPKLVNEDGSVLHAYELRPAWWFRWRFRHVLYPTLPPAFGVIEDLQETNPEA